MTTQISGTTGVSQVQPGVVVDASLTLTANSAPIKTAVNASGNAPIYACRAWVNFNGTGTPAVRASGNVTSITDLGVGNYRINFTTAMQDTNYSWSVASDRNQAPLSYMNIGASSLLTGSFTMITANSSLVAVDADYISAQIFR